MEITDEFGAIVRKNKAGSKEIRLIFSVDEVFEGADYILDILKKEGVKGSFFMTGNALRNSKFKNQIIRILEEGHYLGGHSDAHLQYASWGDRTSLVSSDSLLQDLSYNQEELGKWGIQKEEASYFLPPYEWYNQTNIEDIKSFGWQPINFTRGLRVAADYTIPSMKNYMSSSQIIKHLDSFEQEKTLDGAIILIHPGTDPERTDKFYKYLGRVIKGLKQKEYTFHRF